MWKSILRQYYNGLLSALLDVCKGKRFNRIEEIILPFSVFFQELN